MLYFAPVATVVIAANPYEGELCKKALGETGLQVEVAEGGDGLLELIAAQRRPPLAVVISDGLFCGDMQDLLREVREKHPQLPVFLIAERGGDVPDEAAATWLGARKLFFRPVDVERFADAVEKLAVEAELASEVSEQLEAVHAEPPAGEAEIELEAEFESEGSPAPKPVEPSIRSSIGRLALKQVRREEPIVELPVRRAPTEIIAPHSNGEQNPAPAAPAPIPASSSAEGILRADDAMPAEAGLAMMDLVVREPEESAAAGGVAAAETAPFDEPRFARRLDRELKAAERRLFPDSPGRAPIYDDYDDALGDIDLDSLGIDTMPGIGADALDAALEAPTAAGSLRGEAAAQAGAAARDAFGAASAGQPARSRRSRRRGGRCRSRRRGRWGSVIWRRCWRRCTPRAGPAAACSAAARARRPSTSTTGCPCSPPPRSPAIVWATCSTVRASSRASSTCARAS